MIIEGKAMVYYTCTLTDFAWLKIVSTIFLDGEGKVQVSLSLEVLDNQTEIKKKSEIQEGRRG